MEYSIERLARAYKKAEGLYIKKQIQELNEALESERKRSPHSNYQTNIMSGCDPEEAERIRKEDLKTLWEEIRRLRRYLKKLEG